MASELRRRRIKLDPAGFAGEANAKRTPGIHLTDVLRDIDGVLGRLKKNSFSADDLDAFALEGYLWEWEMTETLVSRVMETDGSALDLSDYQKLPEIAVRFDGSAAFEIDYQLDAEIRQAITKGCLIMSPDGARSNPDRLWECKRSRKSPRFDPDSQRDGKPQWFHQAKVNLLGLSMIRGKFIGSVEWHVSFPWGEQRHEPPVYEIWERDYDQAEISQSWAMVGRHVEWRVKGDAATGGGTDPHGWGKYLL